MVSKVGPPTKYKPEYCEQARKLCLLGAIDIEMADFFGVAESTFHLWKKEHPEFKEALQRGKMIADANVASRLYERAMGYSHKETKIATMEGVITDMKEVTKHYPPDSTSAIFWLKNRQPQKWRDKTETSITLNDDFDSLMDDSLSD